MITVILPGYSPHNKDWAVETSKSLNLNHEIRPIFWDHWTDAEIPFDPKDKAQEIVDVAMSDFLNIIAKSIGSLVAAHIVKAIPGRIEKLILCGIPLNDMTEADIEVIREALHEFPAKKILCIQNEDDPHGNFDQLKAFLAKVNGEIKIISKDRNDHEYPYYSDFENFLKV